MRFYFLLPLLFVGQLSLSQNDTHVVEATVNQDDIKAHIYFLSDDLLKGRETGTSENKIAASYLANTLRSYGVRPNPKTGTFYQTVPLEKTTPSALSLSLSGTKVSNVVAFSFRPISYQQDAVYLGHGLEEDYQGADVSGKLVVVQGGSDGNSDPRSAFGLRAKKAELAKNAGALGLIEMMAFDAQIWSYLDHNFNAPSLTLANGGEEISEEFAHIWAQAPSNVSIGQLASNELIPVTLQMDSAKIEVIKSQNVIGVVEGTDPKLKNEYIIYSAHYDHVGIGAPDATGDSIYNGARDNAVGAVTVLSMAENLAKHPTKRSALFILFTAEEKGLLGSEYYIENPVLPLEQMVYCFNSDNGGYNDTSLATIIGLERTTAAQYIKDAASAFGLRAIEDPSPEQGLFDRSDNVHFAKKGIPAPTFSLGFSAFDEEINKYYHQPGDHANSIDYDYLLKFFRAYVLAGRKIANAKETPFWMEGDTYEPNGLQLYGKK